MKSLILLLLALALTDLTAQTYEQKMQFLDSVNKYRVAVGVRPYKYDFQADSLAKRRVQTIYEHLDTTHPFLWYNVSNEQLREHTHFRSNEDFDWFNRTIVHQDTTTSWRSECSGFFNRSYLSAVTDLTTEFFNGWKSSPEHWKMIMDSDFQYLAIFWTKHPTLNYIVPMLVLFDKNERSPDKIKYFKGTKNLRPGYPE